VTWGNGPPFSLAELRQQVETLSEEASRAEESWDERSLRLVLPGRAAATPRALRACARAREDAERLTSWLRVAEAELDRRRGAARDRMSGG